jgi:hypothetical protein
MESEADRRATLSALGGKDYQTAAGPLLGVFDNEYMEGLDTESRLPVLTCTTADAVAREAVRKGATVDIDGTTYRVDRHEPDGTGMSRLILRA